MKTQAIYDTWRNDQSNQQHSNTARETGVVNSEQRHSKGHSSRLAMTTWLSSNKRSVLHIRRLTLCMPTWITSWCHSKHPPITSVTPPQVVEANIAVALTSHYGPPKPTVKRAPAVHTNTTHSHRKLPNHSPSASLGATQARTPHPRLTHSPPSSHRTTQPNPLAL